MFKRLRKRLKQHIVCLACRGIISTYFLGGLAHWPHGGEGCLTSS